MNLCVCCSVLKYVVRFVVVVLLLGLWVSSLCCLRLF